nr:MAG TPA: hypothetical protein [Caudoviricetes sp.]
MEILFILIGLLVNFIKPEIVIMLLPMAQLGRV